jgi:hypothetical protein
VSVPPGPVRVEVRSPGYVGTTVSVVVGAGQRSRVDVRLERDRAVTPAPVSSAGATLAPPATTARPLPPTLAPREDVAVPSVIEPVPEKADPPDRPPPEPGASAGVRTARWVLVAAAAVFVAGGTAGLLIREQNVKTFNNDNCFLANQGTVKGPTNQSGSCKALAQNASTAKVVGIVGMAGAGVLAVTSAVLFIAF